MVKLLLRIVYHKKICVTREWMETCFHIVKQRNLWEKKMEGKKVVKELGMAVGSSVVATLFFLVVTAMLMFKAGLGEEAVSKIMIAGYVLAPAVGGFIMGKKRKVNRFLWGLCVGTVYFLVYVLVAVCIKDVSFGDIVWVAIPVCLGGMAGGMLS